MSDPLRIKSTLPLAIRIAEPHPDADKPGDSPALKQFVLRPGVNELGETDAATYRAWAEVNPGFIASADDIKAGTTDGKVYEMADDEPDQEFGFEPALKRATEGDNGKSAADGSTLTDKGPVKAEDMRPSSADAAPAPVLTAKEPLKTPVTVDPAPPVPAAAAVTK